MANPNDPNNQNPFAAWGQGYDPTFSGIHNTYLHGMENTPFFGSGPGSIVGSILANPLMDRVGMFPAGAGTNRNFADTIRQMQFTKLQRQAAADAGKLDAANYYDTFRGVSNLMGVEFGPDQQRAAAGMSAKIGSLAPLLGAFRPDLLEQFGGSRGSASVLASRLAESGRYRSDPVSGGQGLTRESIKQLTEGIFKDLLGPGGENRYGGLMAGQVGALQGSLQSRGISGGEGSFTDNARRAARQMSLTAGDDLAAAAKRQGVLTTDVNKMSAMDLDKLAGDDVISQKMRTIDLDRTKRMLKDYSKAVGVMKEIFGDMGRPNAPMAELINGLDALTAGGSTRMAPEQLARIARQTQTLATQSGLPMGKVAAMQATAAQMAAGMGLDPMAAVGAVQSGMMMGAALQSSGAMAHPVWNRGSLDQQVQMTMVRNLQASKSESAAALAAAVDFSKMAGGFEKGSDAERLVAAIRSGSPDFVDASGNKRRTGMRPSEIVDILKGAKDASGRHVGITDAQLQTYMNQADRVGETVVREGIGLTVLQGQGLDARQVASDGMNNQLIASLVEKGVSRDDAMRIVTGGGGMAAASAFLGIKGGYSADKAASAVGRSLLASAARDPAVKAILDKMTPAEREMFVKEAGGGAVGAMNGFLHGTGDQMGGSAPDFFTQHSDETRRSLRTQQTRAQATNMQKEIFEGLQPEEPLRNFIDGLRGIKSSDKGAFGKLLAKTFGGVDKAGVDSAVGRAAAELQKRMEDYDKEIRRILDLPAEQQAAALGALVDEQRQIKGQITDLGEKARTAGMPGQGGSVFNYAAEALASGRETAADRLELGQDTLPESVAATQDMVNEVTGSAKPFDEKGSLSAMWEGVGGTQRIEVANAVARTRKKEVLAAVRAGVAPDKPGSKALYDEMLKGINTRAASIKGSSAADAREKALQWEEQSMDYTDPFILSQTNMLLDPVLGRVETDAEGRSFIVATSQAKASRAGKVDAAKLNESFGGKLSKAEADSLADLKQQARKLGIPEAKIEEIFARARDNAEGLSAYEAAHDELRAAVEDKNLLSFDPNKDFAAQAAEMQKNLKDREKLEGFVEGKNRAETYSTRHRTLAEAMDHNREFSDRGGAGVWDDAKELSANMDKLDDLARELDISTADLIGGRLPVGSQTKETSARFVEIQKLRNALLARNADIALNADRIGRRAKPTGESLLRADERWLEHEGAAPALPGEAKSLGVGLLQDFDYDTSKLSDDDRTQLKEIDARFGDTQNKKIQEILHAGLRAVKGKGAGALQDYMSNPDAALDEYFDGDDAGRAAAEKAAKLMHDWSGGPIGGGTMPDIGEFLRELLKRFDESREQTKAGATEIRGEMTIHHADGLASVTGTTAPNANYPA